MIIITVKGKHHVTFFALNIILLYFPFEKVIYYQRIPMTCGFIPPWFPLVYVFWKCADTRVSSIEEEKTNKQKV